METRNIFIDTSIFIGQNYNYKGNVFESILRLSKTGNANIFITDIVLKEIKDHIRADVSKAIQASTKFKKNARVLRNINEVQFNELFNEIDEVEITGKLEKQLDTFINDLNATILTTSNVSIDNVMNDYFNKKAPFGEGKKKSEFPDAFTLEALNIWCNETNEKIYVASTDPDLMNYCESNDNLFSLDGIAKFISIIELHDEVLAPKLLELIDKNKNTVNETITDTFLNQGFWIIDQEGEVNEVHVNDQIVNDIFILDINDDSATVQFDVSSNYSADLSYDDLDTAAYDSEDKVLIPWDTVEKTVDQDVNYTVTASISYDKKEPKYFDMDSIKINSERSYDFPVNSDDEYPYK